VATTAESSIGGSGSFLLVMPFPRFHLDKCLLVFQVSIKIPSGRRFLEEGSGGQLEVGPPRSYLFLLSLRFALLPFLLRTLDTSASPGHEFK